MRRGTLMESCFSSDWPGLKSLGAFSYLTIDVEGLILIS